MRRFKKKVAFAFTAASLIVACCSCVNASMAFAQGSPEAPMTEESANLPSQTKGNSQSDTSEITESA